VAGNDPWLGVAWKVYAVQGAASADLKPADKEGTFTLSPVPDPAMGPATYYKVHFNGDDMPKCWDKLVLYPHGTAVFAPPAPPLKPWTQSGDAPWLAAADAVRKGLNDSMARLEGLLYPDTNGANLTLVCVPNATTSGTPLLVMQLVSGGAPGSMQAQNVTGGGHGDN